MEIKYSCGTRRFRKWWYYALRYGENGYDEDDLVFEDKLEDREECGNAMPDQHQHKKMPKSSGRSGGISSDSDLDQEGKPIGFNRESNHLATTVKHLQIWQNADKKYKRAAEKMANNNKKNVHGFLVSDRVSLSLREAAKQQAPWNKFTQNTCKCTTGCSTNKCRYFWNKLNCSSHCHGGKPCTNKKYDDQPSSSGTKNKRKRAKEMTTG